jgi:hypothetical protein
MVHEMLEVYASRIGIPQTVGRGRWFTTALVTRVIIGHHLQFVEVSAQRWDQTHLDWLENCRLEYVKWTGEVPGYATECNPSERAAMTRPSRLARALWTAERPAAEVRAVARLACRARCSHPQERCLSIDR